MTYDDASEGTILASKLALLVRVLPLLELDAEEVSARAGLSADLLSLPESARVPVRVEQRLWQAMEEVAGECTVGLRVAEIFLQAGLPCLEGYLARNAPTLRHVLTDMDRFAPIVDDRMRLLLSEHVETATIRLSRIPDRAQSQVECQFAVMAGFVRRYVRGVPISRVRLRRPRPRELGPYRDAFDGVVPDFGTTHNELVFPRSALEQPVQGADPGLSIILESHAQQIVARVPTGDPFLQCVREALRGGISDGRVSIDRVARTLAISERTLRRQLLSRQTSYQSLVDEVRCEYACKLLSDNERVHAVAERVGFRSTSAFQKAFARWTQTSPSAYRRQHRNGHAEPSARAL